MFLFDVLAFPFLADVGHTVNFALYISTTSSAAATSLMRPKGKSIFLSVLSQNENKVPLIPSKPMRYTWKCQDVLDSAPGLGSADPNQCCVLAGCQEATTMATTPNIFLNT